METYSFQKQNQYNKFLPYFEELEEQAEDEFIETLQNLRELKKPVLDVPKLIQWTHVLENYIAKHGFRFTKKDHVWLVTYFYDLLCGVKNIDKGSFDKISKMTHTLLAKEYLLTGSDLEIDWKPLAQLMEYHWSSPFRTRNLDITPSYDDLWNIIMNARPFFKKGSTQEILEEWRPYLNFHNTSSMGKGMELF